MPERYMPTTADVCAAYVAACGEYRDLAEEWFKRWLDRQLATARAEGMRATADWLEGGTPRAYSHHHPCDPPGTRWEPNETERAFMSAVDGIREAADQIEKEADQ